MIFFVCELMRLCVGEDMGFWLCTNVVLRVYEDVGLCRNGFVWLLVCLLVRWHINLQSAYCPLVPQSLRPPPLGERGEGNVCFVHFVAVLPECVRFYFATS